MHATKYCIQRMFEKERRHCGCHTRNLADAFRQLEVVRDTWQEAYISSDFLFWSVAIVSLTELDSTRRKESNNGGRLENTKCREEEERKMCMNVCNTFKTYVLVMLQFLQFPKLKDSLENLSRSRSIRVHTLLSSRKPITTLPLFVKHSKYIHTYIAQRPVRSNTVK